MSSTTTVQAAPAGSGAATPNLIPAATLPFTELGALGPIVAALEVAGHVVRLDVARSRGALYGVSVLVENLFVEDDA